MTNEQTTTVSEYEQIRLDKATQLRQLGVDPYGGRFDEADALAAIASRYDQAKEDQVVRGAGRIVLHRDIGKLIFMTLRDSSGTIQVGLSKKLLSETWALAKLLDLGDIVGV